MQSSKDEKQSYCMQKTSQNYVQELFNKYIIPWKHFKFNPALTANGLNSAYTLVQTG